MHRIVPVWNFLRDQCFSPVMLFVQRFLKLILAGS